MHRPSSDLTERQLLKAVCRGDEDPFRRLVEPHRPGLQAHCDRMLGSRGDGEDALQEALLRAWRGLSRFERRASLRNWLYRIATNTSLDARARRPEPALPIDDALPADVIGREETAGSEARYAAPAARVEQRDTAELAVVAALRHLPARQRAVLILREVFGFSADEVAHALGTTVAAVNSALQRAHRALNDRSPSETRPPTMRSRRDERLRELAHNIGAAFEGGDVETIVAELIEDARSPSYAEAA